ncbi:hypothetical protein [Vreelandella sp. EE27]
MVIVLLLAGLGMWGLDIAEDRSKLIKITEPIPAFDHWKCGYTARPDCSVIFDAVAGTEYEVRRIRYGKDFMAIQIEQKGERGWVLWGESLYMHARKG